MRRFLASSLLFAVALASGCATKERATLSSFYSQRSQDREIYVTVYHSMFAHWKGHQFDFPERFFLSSGDQEVSPELLSEFRSEGYQVAAGFEYRHGLGIECSVGKIEWVSKTEAKVWGGYLFGPLGGEWGYFTLKKDHDKWTITSWKPELFA
jgi:hypothetical protein